MRTRASLPRRTPTALWTDCRSRFPRHEVFACSVTGATAYRDSYGRRQQVPLRIEPHGIIEPFGWLMTELDENWNKPGVAARLVAATVDAGTSLESAARLSRCCHMSASIDERHDELQPTAAPPSTHDAATVRLRRIRIAPCHDGNAARRHRAAGMARRLDVRRDRRRPGRAGGARPTPGSKTRRRAGRRQRSRNRGSSTCAAPKPCGNRLRDAAQSPAAQSLRGDRDHLAAGGERGDAVSQLAPQHSVRRSSAQLSHRFEEPPEQIVAVVRAGGGFGVILHAEGRHVAVRRGLRSCRRSGCGA